MRLKEILRDRDRGRGRDLSNDFEYEQTGFFSLSLRGGEPPGNKPIHVLLVILTHKYTSLL